MRAGSAENQSDLSKGEWRPYDLQYVPICESSPTVPGGKKARQSLRPSTIDFSRSLSWIGGGDECTDENSKVEVELNNNNSSRK